MRVTEHRHQRVLSAQCFIGRHGRVPGVEYIVNENRNLVLRHPSDAIEVERHFIERAIGFLHQIKRLVGVACQCVDDRQMQRLTDFLGQRLGIACPASAVGNRHQYRLLVGRHDIPHGSRHHRRCPRYGHTVPCLHLSGNRSNLGIASHRADNVIVIKIIVFLSTHLAYCDVL